MIELVTFDNSFPPLRQLALFPAKMTLVRARAILIIEYWRLLIFVVAEVYLGILWACVYSCHLVREVRERSYHAHFRWEHINTSPLISSVLKVVYTAMSRKVVGKSARDNPVSYCGWFLVHCSSKKFERMARKAMDLFLWVLKESNKSRFDGYSVRNIVLIISHVTFRDCCVHIFSDYLSWNNCMHCTLRVSRS